MDAVAVIELAGAVLQIQIEYVISPPGHIFDWLRAICAVTQMTAGVGDGLGLGELDPEAVGVPDGGVLGVWLGVAEVVLGDGLGVSDGLASPVSATAENTEADPGAQGECADPASRTGAADAATAGASAEPDNKNTLPAIKAAARKGPVGHDLIRAIPVGTAALR